MKTALQRISVIGIGLFFLCVCGISHTQAQTINIGPNQYAFRFTQNPNYGLFFNATNVQYEFRNGTAVPILAIDADNGNLKTNLQFSAGNSYLVAPGTYAARSSAAQQAGLFFGTTDFEFRSTTGVPSMQVNATNGNTAFSGNVGINVQDPQHRLDVGGTISASTSSYAIRGIKTGTGTFPGVWGETESTSSNASGVRGYVSSTSPGGGSAGVHGKNFGTNGFGSGVRGTHDSGGYGVFGETVTGRGVSGHATAGSFTGTAYGVYGISTGTGSSGTRIGVYGTASGGSNNWAGFFVGNEYVSGNLAVGTTTLATGYRISVNGGVMCTTVKVQALANWPDYVFGESYDLMKLEDLEQFVTKNKHLPGIPSAAEVEEADGFDLSDMQKKTLEKVEELTLYLIEQNKTIKAQQELLDAYRQELDALKTVIR